MSQHARSTQNALALFLTITAVSVVGAQEPSGRAGSGPTIRVSMADAVAMALETSLGLKDERLNVEASAQSVLAAKAAFQPFLSTGLARNTNQSPAFVFENGTSAVASSSALSASGTVSQQLPRFGGSYAATWAGSRNASAGSSSSTFNPRLGSSVRFDLTQPLWRNFGTDASRTAVARSERQRSIADVQLEQRVVATEAAVKSAYLGLLAALEGRKVAQQNMDLAEQSLRNSRARVEVGQSPQIDLVTAEAAVESNREQLIVAEARIATAQDDLRTQILDPARPDYWTAELVPTDAIQLTPQVIDVDAAIQRALASRLDLASLKKSMEITDVNIELSQNLTKPAVDLNLSYLASGTGGTQLQNGVTSVRGFGSVLGDTFGAAYPSWTFGVTVGYPLGRSSAQANLAQGQIERRQQDLQRRQLELDIVSQVRQAGRDVQTSYQRVQATQAARSASERQLDAEERRFAVGLSDTFQLQTRQSQLAASRVAELNAVIAYNSALIALERVQKIR